jgi:hypothetical protein
VTSPNLQAHIYDPETLAAMDQAFPAVWRILVADGVTEPLRLRNLSVKSLLTPRHRDARCCSMLRTGKGLNNK